MWPRVLPEDWICLEQPSEVDMWPTAVEEAMGGVRDAFERFEVSLEVYEFAQEGGVGRSLRTSSCRSATEGQETKVRLPLLSVRTRRLRLRVEA